MAVTGLPYSGIDGEVESAGTEIRLSKWQVTPRVPANKTTNFTSQGFREQVKTVAEVEVTCSGFWDGNLNPHQNPVNLKAGMFLSNLKLYVSRTDDLFFEFPSFYVETVPVQNDVDGKVELTFTGWNDGPFTYPGD